MDYRYSHKQKISEIIENDERGINFCSSLKAVQ